MLKKMVLNVAVGTAIVLVVLGPQKAVDLYLDAHATVVQVLLNLA